jgi:hypothetical protein
MRINTRVKYKRMVSASTPFPHETSITAGPMTISKRMIFPAKIELLQSCDEFLLQCNGADALPSEGTKPRLNLVTYHLTAVI